MSGLVENFIRRIEKITDQRSTVPLAGTNHVDDNWINTDIYPGELSINLSTGSLYTSDGLALIDLNRENFIMSGLVVSKYTSGVNKLTVSDGSVRINGKNYYYQSSGTDILLPFNYGIYDRLYFIYAQPTTTIATGFSASAGNLMCALGYTSVDGPLTEPGIFSTVALTSGVPAMPSDSILLGTVLLYRGATGYDLWPRSVANIGDYYPMFSHTPSDFLRKNISVVSFYEPHGLFFPGEFVVDTNSNTSYLSTQIFVSDYSTISNDISMGNLVSIGGGGGTGSSGSMTVSNLGSGLEVYKTIVGSQIQLRSINATSPIQISYDGGSNEIILSLSNSFSYLAGLTNLGTGSQVWQSTSSNIAKLRSIKAGSANVQVTSDINTIYVDVPNLGTTAQGINLGTGLTMYVGMSGKDLTFNSLGFTGGLTSSVTNDTILISGQNLITGASNTGAGPGFIYSGIDTQKLQFRGLSAGSNITITTLTDTILISSSGGGGTSSIGANIGSTGATAGVVFLGMSGNSLNFGSLIGAAGIQIANSGNDVIIASTVTNGAQGPQGLSGTNGIDGITGSQGPQGLKGTTGADSTVRGPQGFQGFGHQGFQGIMGYQGLMGPQGIPSDMRMIDVYDNTGGNTINVGGNSLVSFGTTRINSGSSLYTPVGATSITINENGNYIFIYTVSYTVTANGIGKFYLYDVSASAKVDGSDIYMNAKGSDTIITATGKVGMTCSAGSIYAIKGECSNAGPLTSYADASSFSISKLEVGIGPQGPSSIGVQGPEGPMSLTANATVSVNSPLTGDGATSTPILFQYSDDFNLDISGNLCLNLDYTLLVTPTIIRNWDIYKNNGSTPFPSTQFGYVGITYTMGSTSTYSAINVPNGCKVSYGGTATIPTGGTGFNDPTVISGDWTWGATTSYPISSYINFSGLTSNQTYTVDVQKPKEGLILYNNHVVRAFGNDDEYASDSITFLDIFYWGGCTSLGEGNISQLTADTISSTDIQNLSNYRLGTNSQNIYSVTDSAGSRIVIAYPAIYGDLNNIILDDSLPITSAFLKRTSDLSITTIAGIIKIYRVYVAIADNSYINRKITTS